MSTLDPSRSLGPTPDVATHPLSAITAEPFPNRAGYSSMARTEFAFPWVGFGCPTTSRRYASTTPVVRPVWTFGAVCRRSGASGFDYDGTPKSRVGGPCRMSGTTLG